MPPLLPPQLPPPPDSAPAPAPEPVRARGASALLAPLDRLVLSGDRRRRRFLLVLLSNALVYAASIAMMIFGSRRGLFDAYPAMMLGVLMGATVALFYLVFRTGLNEQFADPTLSVQQSIAAQTLIAGAYGVVGPVHGGILVLFPMVMFFAMFHVHPRYGRLVAAYTVALVGAIMWWRCLTQPAYYQPAIELIWFVLLAVSMFAVTQIAAQSSVMRARLKAHKGALEQALAHIQQMATHDDLTGLANRRHVMDLLAGHAERHARGGPAFYVAIADLDHFKHINDTHGHAVGDEALRTFAVVASAQLRTTDVIGRWGGEEFLLLLPESQPGDPTVGIERLRDALTRTPASSHVPELRVRFSAGLSRYRPGEAVADTIERADRALYSAKGAGRNRALIL